MYAAIKRSNVRPGQWIVIVGAGGGLGHLGVQLASRGMGLRVIGIDHPSKAELVLSSGAEHFVDITQFPKDVEDTALSTHVAELAGGLGAHAAVVCTSSNEAYAHALRFLRFNGTLVCVGLPHGTDPIASSSPAAIIAKQCNIIGSAVGNRQDANEVLEFAARGIIKAHVRIEGLHSLTKVFQEMHEGKLQGRVVLDLR
jgi:propanol-preferring alcohol dehydrogenase